MAKKIKKQGNLLAGIEKFQEFAKSRAYDICQKTYGIYRIVSKNGKTSKREAVRAYKIGNDGSAIFGWIINLAGRERVFKPDGSGYKVFA